MTASSGCPQCAAAVVKGVDQFCPSCGYPLFWEEHADEDRAGTDEAAMMRRPDEAATGEVSLAGSNEASQPTAAFEPVQRGAGASAATASTSTTTTDVDCPNCGTGNPASRTSCRRCEALLSPTPPSTGRERGGPWLPLMGFVAGGLLLVGLVAGVVWLLADDEVARLVDVRAGRHETFDRLVWEVQGTRQPELEVRRAQRPAGAEPDGDAVQVEGAALLEVVLEGASGIDRSGDQPRRVFRGPGRLTVPNGGHVVREAVQVSDRDGRVSWLVGLSGEATVETLVLDDPEGFRLVVDVSPAVP